eukprot:2824631-Prymnesium_polylepis.1
MIAEERRRASESKPLRAPRHDGGTARRGARVVFVRVAAGFVEVHARGAGWLRRLRGAPPASAPRGCDEPGGEVERVGQPTGIGEERL